MASKAKHEQKQSANRKKLLKKNKKNRDMLLRGIYGLMLASAGTSIHRWLTVGKLEANSIGWGAY
jgi:hypothetical protein